MKPKLIVLSGPLGSGKTTLAEMYSVQHSLSLRLDIDDIWSMIGNSRELHEESSALAKYLTFEITKLHLKKGFDVIIPQLFDGDNGLAILKKIAQEEKVDFYDIYLQIEQDDSSINDLEQIHKPRPKSVLIKARPMEIDQTYKDLIKALK